MVPQLQAVKANLTILDFGHVRMYFSYDACIAFRTYNYGKLVTFPTKEAYNPTYRKYSNTTTKHAKELGCFDFPDSATFEADLEARVVSDFGQDAS